MRRRSRAGRSVERKRKRIHRGTQGGVVVKRRRRYRNARRAS